MGGRVLEWDRCGGGGGKMVEVIWENRFRERERVGRIFGWRFRMIEEKKRDRRIWELDCHTYIYIHCISTLMLKHMQAYPPPSPPRDTSLGACALS